MDANATSSVESNEDASKSVSVGPIVTARQTRAQKIKEDSAEKEKPSRTWKSSFLNEHFGVIKKDDEEKKSNESGSGEKSKRNKSKT